MSSNSFFSNNRSSLSGWLIVLGVMGIFAFYQYSQGYDYAKENQIADENICDNAFHYGRRSLRSFKVMGCKSQVADNQEKLESKLGFEASNVNDKELIILMQQDLAKREKRRNHYDAWLARCDGDLEACIENTPQDNGFGNAPSAVSTRPALSDEECESEDVSGFLPEC